MADVQAQLARHAKLYYLAVLGSSAGKKIRLQCRRPRFNSWVRKISWRRDRLPLQYSWASLVAQLVKNLSAIQETWVGKIPWRRTWQPTLVFLPGESLWREEPGGLQSMGLQRDTTERLSTAQHSTPVCMDSGQCP